NLLGTIERIYSALTVTVEEFRIVIFDDGSTDDTAAAAKRASEKYPFVMVHRNERRLGLGYCMVAGSREADTPFVVYAPADNTWPLRSFIELFGHLGKADVVTSYSNNLLTAMPPFKRVVSRAYTIVLNLLFGRVLHYYNGLTIYPTEFLARGAIRTHGFGFPAEALLKAVASGYSFLEIALPVDAGNLPASRSITPANIANAVATIIRLVWEFHFSGKPGPRRLKLSARPSGGQGADEIGVNEPLRAPSPGAQPCVSTRAPLRILISGASSGIGAALAQSLSRQGHQLFVFARRGDRLAEVARGFERIETHVCDVSDEAQIERLIVAVQKRTQALDVLINCAGGFGEIGPITLADSSRWWTTVETNLKGTYLLTRHALPLLQKGTQARIINFAGGGAFSPFPNYSAYACSKTAIVRLTECLADELAPYDIRVNAIAPGFVPTPMHDATLAAGEKRAGRMQYQRTTAILAQGGPSMEHVVRCVAVLLLPAFDDLTGKTISSNFDPWEALSFRECLPEIVRSDLYTLRRINVVNLPDGRLRETLSRPWADARSAQDS
ncbi:MAG TPA: SDR family NAD(P)-dependent oxidoreductase, partial [Xanthobacteraceae bacterium]